MKAVKNIIVIVLIFFLLLLAIKQQLDINSLHKEITSLEEDLKTIQYENDKKQNELDSTDEERAEKYAKENGYKDPNARYFINDMPQDSQK